jgi:CDP-diacylglycerol--glycerol-3-phosphate 3-phosphatidyltransferase
MQTTTKQIWNVPNRLSLARLVLSLVVFFLIPLELFWGAFWVFVIAAGTDWVDGWYARRYSQVTQLGRILDPFCDKILICGVFILLAVEMHDSFPWYAQIAGWMAVVVTARELLVTGLRGLVETGGGDFSAKMHGKLKMWFQCIAAAAALVALAMKQADSATELPRWLTSTLVISIWAAVLSTIYSGALYAAAAWEPLTGGKK